LELEHFYFSYNGMIKTENIKLTNKDLFNILITSYLRKRWWLLVWIWVMIAILLLRRNNDSLGYFIVAALILFQIVMVFQYWNYANSKDNAPFLQERKYEIDSDRIVGITSDGISTSIEIQNFISLAKTSKYYLLYTTTTQFICIPFSSFKSNEDMEWFEKEIVSKVKK
jgi:hypothetical protein